MRIAVITPSYPPSVGGNATTSSRIVDGIKSRKVKTIVFLPSQLKKQNNIKKLIRFKPDLIHAFHAYKSGIIGMDICKKLDIPLIVTITGTDVNVNLFQKDKKGKIKEVLEFAKSIVVFHKSMMEIIPHLKNKIKIIKQTVKLKHKYCNIRKKLKLRKNDFIFFLPAALRPIKYGYFYIDEFVKLNKEYNIKLIIAGPVLDDKFAKYFIKKIKKYDWIYYIPRIQHDEIKCVFEDVDAALNTSVSEGGMSNAVLEAMSVGKPVLASGIEGNISVIKDNYNGFIFGNKNEFYRKAESLILNRKLRRKLSRNGKILIKEKFHYKEEIKGYLSLI